MTDSTGETGWHWMWVISGVLLAGLLCTLVGLSGVSPGALPSSRYISVILYFVAGAAYLAAIWAAPKVRLSLRSGAWLLGVALVLRLAMWFTPEIPGGDHYRYLWDGAVTAQGRNPYTFSPQQVLQGNLPDPELAQLATQGRPVLSQINHPQLRTIYPPAAQGLWALAYWMSPFQSTGWRIVLLAIDCLGAWLLLTLLRQLGLPVAWLSAYLWNPLLVVESHRYLHLDLALVPALLILAWALWRDRTVIAAVALAAGVGLKLWPALFLPLLMARFRTDRRRLIVALAVFLSLVACMTVPFWKALGTDRDSGAVAYSKTWDANALVYWVFHKLGWGIVRSLESAVDGRIIGRGLMMVLLSAIAVWQARRCRQATLSELGRRMGFVAAVMLLLSPTLYAWYYVPLIAPATLSFRPALLLWTLLLPLTSLGRGVPGRTISTIVVHLLGWTCVWFLARSTGTERRDFPGTT